VSATLQPVMISRRTSARSSPVGSCRNRKRGALAMITPPPAKTMLVGIRGKQPQLEAGRHLPLAERFVGRQRQLQLPRFRTVLVVRYWNGRVFVAQRWHGVRLQLRANGIACGPQDRITDTIVERRLLPFRPLVTSNRPGQPALLTNASCTSAVVFSVSSGCRRRCERASFLSWS